MKRLRNVIVAVTVAAMAPALPAAAQEPTEAQMIAEFEVAIRELRDLMMRRGEQVEGWNVGGADPDADLRRMGTGSYYFLSRSASEDSVTILTDRPIGHYAPRDWQVADTYGGEGAPAPGGQVDFVPLSARYVFASRSRADRRGDVDCFGNIDEAILYEIPDAPETEGDDTVPAMFRMTILAMEDEVICMRSDGDRRRGWRSRSFTEDGYTLPEIDAGREDEVMSIVPAAPIDALIAWRGFPEAGPELY